MKGVLRRNLPAAVSVVGFCGAVWITKFVGADVDIFAWGALVGIVLMCVQSYFEG